MIQIKNNTWREAHYDLILSKKGDVNSILVISKYIIVIFSR